MSDIKKGLPIRTEQDADERVQIKVVDFTTPANGQTIDTDGNAHVETHGNDPAGSDRALRTSEQGHSSTDGVHDAVNNTDPSNVGMIAHTRNASPADAQQTERLTSIENAGGDVRSLDVAIRQADGEPFSESNPLHVTMAENPGDEIVDPNEGVDIAADGTNNHDYVVPAGKTLIVDLIEFGSSARGAFEVIVDPAGSPVSYGKRFTSSANNNAEMKFARRLKVPAGITLRVVQENRDNQSQDLYSMIVGVEV